MYALTMWRGKGRLLEVKGKEGVGKREAQSTPNQSWVSSRAFWSAGSRTEGNSGSEPSWGNWATSCTVPASCSLLSEMLPLGPPISPFSDYTTIFFAFPKGQYVWRSENSRKQRWFQFSTLWTAKITCMYRRQHWCLWWGSSKGSWHLCPSQRKDPSCPDSCSPKTSKSGNQSTY